MRSRALASKVLDMKRVGMPQAVHSHLPYGAGVPTQCRRLVHRADVGVAAFGAIEHCSAPGCGWEGLAAT
jgi:hypothetical protein